MINFNFFLPTKVVFGKDTQNEVGKQVKAFGGTKVLIHYGGGSVKKTGLLDQVKASLDAENIAYVECGGVVPNPLLGKVYESIELAKKEGVDFILAVGGGSVIDSAKAVALGLGNDCDPWDYFSFKGGSADKSTPIGVVLTLAASGSETSKNLIITNEDGGLKRGYANDALRPKFAIMNPELTYSLPLEQTKYGIVDIMMHTMERYFTPTKNVELTDRMSEALLKTMIEQGRKVLGDLNNYDARAEIMWAGSLSHNGLLETGKVGDYGVHQMEHELSGMFDVPHAAGLSAIWASWARYVYKEDVSRFAQYAVRVWNCEMDYYDPEKTALEGIKKTEDFYVELGMPISLKELLATKGVTELTEAQMAEMAEKSTYDHKRVIGNFKKLSEEDTVNIYRMAWER